MKQYIPYSHLCDLFSRNIFTNNNISNSNIFYETVGMQTSILTASYVYCTFKCIICILTVSYTVYVSVAAMIND